MLASLDAAPLPKPAFLHLDEVHGWKIKTYAVAATARARAAVVTAARQRLATALPERPDLDGSLGLGFLIINDNAAGCRALVHWWVRPDELHQRAFVASARQPRSLVPESGTAIGGLLELAIIQHEGEAWRRHVYGNPRGPDLDAYLCDVLA